MSEEIKNETTGEAPNANTTEVNSTETTPVASQTTETANEIAPEQPVEPLAAQQSEISEQAEPQIIVQKERGFAHYVGFALLSILCICFFFMPGIAITFGVSCIVDLTGAAAWIFSAILSFVAWLIFKIKIKGFKKSFYWYIGLCVLVLAILIAIQVGTDANVFGNIITLLSGAKV